QAPAKTMAARAVVPRNIRLMDELEKGEKGQLAGMFPDPWVAQHLLTFENLEACSLGFEDTDEDQAGGLFLPDWKATIIGPPHVRHSVELETEYLKGQEADDWKSYRVLTRTVSIV
ncbi:hypothetical protein MMC30_005586, partial [Trapelia coarctata]|nr:hypothetical protein [Trapelia coarctata]